MRNREPDSESALLERVMTNRERIEKLEDRHERVAEAVDRLQSAEDERTGVAKFKAWVLAIASAAGALLALLWEHIRK